MNTSEPENKRKKPNYYAQKKRRHNILEPGLKGFLCTCNFREKECVREAYDLLNLYADIPNNKIKTDTVFTEEKNPEASDTEDITDDLSKEISSLKSEERKRFQAVESGAKNVIFIKTTLENPVELVCTIIRDILSSKQQKTRFLYRLLPIEITCKANITDIKLAVNKLICKYFVGEPKSYAIIINCRNNTVLHRDELISEIANLIVSTDSKHTVNLKNAELTVAVEVIKGVCLLSVIPNYTLYRKYNLIQLAESVQTVNVDDNGATDISTNPENTDQK